MSKEFQSVVVLTGAGISAESGIRTFRAADGLWEDHPIEQVASPAGFVQDPELVHRFYNQRRSQLLSDTVSPNTAHEALADFERQWPDKFLLVTQNIDDLHERAGSKQLIHIHGELLKLRCAATDQIYDWRTDSSPQSVCDCCQQTDNLRPHVVWFGEMPLEMERIQTSLQQCDLFIAIGTSGHVYPAAGFVQTASQFGAHTVELNLEPSLVGSQFAEQHYGPATKVVPNFLQDLV